MKIISWNTNGLRANIKKGFFDFFDEIDADIFCIQETKMQIHQKDFNFPGYYEYFSDAIKKGYSGTAILTKEKPLNVVYGINGEYSDEGRVITCEYPDFYLVNVYSPNSQEGLVRLPYRMEYEEKLRKYLLDLKKYKSVILCGDLNVAHNEIDLKNPNTNRKNAGFSDEERMKFTKLLSVGFIDTFRYFYPDEIKYTWWSYMFNARKNNAGWRIDYFVVSECLIDSVLDIELLNEVLGSDHCPVLLKLKGDDL